MKGRRLPTVLALAACALAAAGCGQGTDLSNGPVIGKQGDDQKASVALGFPGFATKNTTRVGGADPVADAAGVALAVFAGKSAGERPRAVALVDASNWQGGIAASVFMSPAIRAPVLLTRGGDLPGATSQALDALDPTGARNAGRAQVIQVGDAAAPNGRRVVQVKGSNPYALARSIDRLQSAAVGKTSDRVMIASAQRPEYAMPAAAWAAKAGDPILYVKRDSIPKETMSALKAHQQPKIYVLGPADAVSDKVLLALRRLGTVRRIAGPSPVTNAIAFARFVDGPFGWGVVDPGHGLVFASAKRPMDAAAAAPLSSSGTYGPLLLLDDAAGLPPTLVQYLLDIQPGYERDPVRGVYNHGWMIGDASAVSVTDQARIDTLLEIVPVNSAAKPSS